MLISEFIFLVRGHWSMVCGPVGYSWTSGEAFTDIGRMGLRSEKKGEYFNLPNYLTLGRILLVPVVMVLLIKITPAKSQAYNFTMGLIATAVFIVAGVSDVVDGYYARKFKINAVFGKYFDPLADKLMILGTMIMLIPLGRIPAWMVVVFLAREISITALRGIAGSEEVILPADYWGKKKAALQNMALIGLMIYYPVWGIRFGVLGWYVLILALVITLGSGINYIVQFTRAILKRYP